MVYIYALVLWHIGHTVVLHGHMLLKRPIHITHSTVHICNAYVHMTLHSTVRYTTTLWTHAYLQSMCSVKCLQMSIHVSLAQQPWGVWNHTASNGLLRTVAAKRMQQSAQVETCSVFADCSLWNCRYHT